MAWYNPSDIISHASDWVSDSIGSVSDTVFGTDDEVDRSVSEASDVENFLVDIIMEMYDNPEATPVSAMNNYLEKYQIADDFYATFPEYAESRLTPALQKYKDEMDRVNNMQGVGLKFNGSPVRTGSGTQAQILPMKKMEFLRDNAGKVFEADTGIQQKILDAATNSANTRFGLAQDKLTQVVDPVTQMWQTALAARYGVTPAVQEGSTGILPAIIEGFMSK